MSRWKLLMAISLAVPAVALAQLPPPAPEEAAKKAEAAEKKAASEEAAKVALGKAQDRVASRYRARHPAAPGPIPVVTPAPVATSR